MFRLSALMALLAIFLVSSCKKDLLHWRKVVQLNTHTDSRLNHIRFLDGHVCLVTGGITFERAEVLRSTDGGYTFVNDLYPESGKEAKGFAVGADGTVYLCGTDGTVLHSKDQGKTFQFGRINTWQRYTGVAYPVPDTGVFVNTIVQEYGSIQQVDSNYNVIDEVTFKFGMNDIYMLNASTGYVIGYGAVLKTTDYRRSWHYLDVIGDNFTCLNILGPDMWLCGYNGGIYHSDDEGRHWSKMRNGNDITVPRYRLYSIAFADRLRGWAVGEQGKVIYTRDGGKHWAEYEHFTNSTLCCIAVCPDGTLLMGGDNGVLFRVIP